MPKAAAMKFDGLRLGAKEEGEGQDTLSPVQKLLQDFGLPEGWLSEKKWEFPQSREGCCVTEEEIKKIEAAFSKKDRIAAIDFILRLDQYRWEQEQQAQVAIIEEERAESSLLIVPAPASALAAG